MKKIQQILTLTLPLGFIAVFAVWFLLSPEVDESRTERRLLAKRPTLSFSSVADGSFMNGFEKYMLDQFPMRDGFRTGCIPSATISQSLIFRQNRRPSIMQRNVFGMSMKTTLTNTK